MSYFSVFVLYINIDIMIDILWGFSKDICMISDVVWGKKFQKKDNDIYVQPLSLVYLDTAHSLHCNTFYLELDVFLGIERIATKNLPDCFLGHFDHGSE